MDLTVSRIRAQIARRTVYDQVERSYQKLRNLTPPVNISPLNLSGPAPGFMNLDIDPQKPIKFDLQCNQAKPIHFHVGVIGAGTAGLYAAMILKDLGLSFEVLEASNRPGGRVWTHRFTPKDGDYYEVGAMRFPNTPIMERIFKLLDALDITEDTTDSPKQGRRIPYYYRGPNTPLYYNNILVREDQIPAETEDVFHVSVSNGGTVPDK